MGGSVGGIQYRRCRSYGAGSHQAGGSGYRVIDIATGKVRRKRLRDLDRFVDLERDRLANILSFPNEYRMRMIGRVIGGEKTTHAYSRALHHLLSTIAVEVV